MKRVIVILSLVVSAVVVAAEPLKLAIPQFRASPDAAALASALSGVVANELQRIGVFQVTTADQVRDLISLERQKQLLGGGEGGQGAAELGNQLSVRYLVTGEVNKLKGPKETVLSLQLVLLDAVEGKRISSELVNAKTEGELVSLVGPATVKLVAKALSGRTGTFYVSVAETGAQVKVDDTLRGTTPMPGRLELGAGPHILSVEKDGFVSYQKEVRIKPGEHHEESISLEPSQDFIQRYEASASRYRIGGYVAVGLAVAGFAGAGYFQVQNQNLYGGAEESGTFAFHQQKVLDGFEEEGDVNHRAEATRLRTQIEQGTTFTYVAVGVGAAAAIAATYFFIAGDPPGRYKKYEVISAIAPTKDGLAAALSVRF